MTEIIRGYLQKLVRLHRRPSEFFSTLPTGGNLSSSLAFALVTHWIGSALEFLWRTALGQTTAEIFREMIATSGQFPEIEGFSLEPSHPQATFFQWLLNVGPVIVDPFLTLISILITAALMFVGARVLIPQPSQPVRFDTLVRVAAYGMAPTVFNGLPILGPWIAGIGSLIVTVIGVRIVFQTSRPRAIIITLFPKMILVFAVLLPLMILALGLVSLIGLTLPQ